MRSGDLRTRILLQRLTDPRGGWTDLEDMPYVWASVEPIGEERYRIRIRDRADLRTKADLSPTMRALSEDLTLELDDAFVFERRKEVHLLAHRAVIERDNLEAGVKETTVWPSAPASA